MPRPCAANTAALRSYDAVSGKLGNASIGHLAARSKRSAHIFFCYRSQWPRGYRVCLRCESTLVRITPRAVCVYRDSHCDIQPWARAAHPLLHCRVDPAFRRPWDGKMSISQLILITTELFITTHYWAQ